MKKLLLLLVAVSLSLWVFPQSLTIEVAQHHFKIDETQKLILSHIDHIDSYNNLSDYDELIIKLDNDTFTFTNIPESISYTESYIVQKNALEYTLYFTNFPIISIQSETNIVDEPKTLASFTYTDDEQTVSSQIGIELRGGTSIGYPKKSYGIEFWEDEAGENTRKIQFKNLRKDDDWILKALYNEPLRMRSFVASKLWLDMHTLYYQDDEFDAKSGADLIYTEVFLNGTYNGVYNLSERIDKKQLKLKSYNGAIRGELYKGISWGNAAIFSELDAYDNANREWSGYEMKYPKEDDITDWGLLYNFTDFVINTDDAGFTESIWSLFNQDNNLDYFIFMNLLKSIDNIGKNIYLAKYNTDEPYFYVPWDLDATWGVNWTTNRDSVTQGILFNGLFDRILELNPDNYAAKVSEKWFAYRANLLSYESLTERFEQQYNQFKNQKIYERESLVYPNFPFEDEDFEYLKWWIEQRLLSLDQYFGHLSVNNPEQLSSILYPNPVNGNNVYIKNYETLIGQDVKIYNTLGRLVKQEVISQNFISVRDLEQGMYIVKMKESSFKLIIK